jgi:hypothetical protein
MPRVYYIKHVNGQSVVPGDDNWVYCCLFVDTLGSCQVGQSYNLQLNWP